MRWEKVSVIAEVISAIAVVVSLLYLSGQIREGNALAEAESVHAINSGFTEVEMVFATSAKLPDIYRTVLAGGELDAEERVRFVACLRAYFVWLENADWRTQTVMRTAYSCLNFRRG